MRIVTAEVERVARALCRAHGGNPDYQIKSFRHGVEADGVTVLCHHPPYPQWQRYIVDAEVAIEAMQ